MNPGIHHINRIEVTPCTSAKRKHQFDVRLQYKPGGSFYHFELVYISERVQESIAAGGVSAIHLEPLEINDVTSRVFTPQPRHLIYGCIDTNGVTVAQVPPQIQKSKKWRMWGGVALSLFGTVSIASINPFVGAAFLVAGTHMLCTAWGMPTSSLKWFTTYN